MVSCDPVRSADVPFPLVEGDEGGGSTVGVGRTVCFVIEGDGDVDCGVDAFEAVGAVRFECWGDDGILEYCEGVEGHSC